MSVDAKTSFILRYSTFSKKIKKKRGLMRGKHNDLLN